MKWKWQFVHLCSGVFPFLRALYALLLILSLNETLQVCAKCLLPWTATSYNRLSVLMTIKKLYNCFTLVEVSTSCTLPIFLVVAVCFFSLMHNPSRWGALWNGCRCGCWCWLDFFLIDFQSSTSICPRCTHWFISQ